MRLRTISARISSMVGAAALVAAGLVALPATVGEAPSARADTVSCAQLSLGQPCTVHYDDHPGFNTIEVPPNLGWVTVVLAGGSGAPDAGLGPAGPGGTIIAGFNVDDVSTIDVWLGAQGHSREGGKVGWAVAGDGGIWTNGYSGGGGGAASGLVFDGGSKEEPVLVAGGGGGGGGNGTGEYDWYRGGAGGYGGLPPADGGQGDGQNPGPGGTGGGEPGPLGGNGDGDVDGNPPGAGGGGGGGGYAGGRGGEHGVDDGPAANTGGGGGGGSSYALPGVWVYGYGVAPIGPGWVTIIPGAPDLLQCNGSGDARQLSVPEDVIAYSVIAVGGAGSPGNNYFPGGHGGLVTGTLDVRGIDTLDYWVGCSGAADEWSGWGYGRGGNGGHGPRFVGKDGGRGGGATALALTDGTMLVAAGGGGGAGGDSICERSLGTGDGGCGGTGGSGGGTPLSALRADGDDSEGGGSGGIAGSNYSNGQPDPNGAEGESGVVPPGDDSGGGGGGGGGSGWPAGGTGGHASDYNAAGGGGAGSSYFNSHYIPDGMISTSGQVIDDLNDGHGYLLLIPIHAPDVDITVQKAVSGAADEFAQGPFTMQLVCTVGTQTVVDTTFQVDAGGEHTVPAPQGADCAVTETGTGGASTPASPQQFTVGTEPSTVTMTNEFAAATLELTIRSAVLDEGGQPTSDVTLHPGTYAVAVSCTLDGHELLMPSPVDHGVVMIDGDTTFTEDGVTVSIPGLPVGASCAVTEQPDAHATSVAYTADGSPSEAGEAFTVQADGSQVDIANSYQLAALSIPKVAGGEGTVPDGATFAGEVTCTFAGSAVSFADPRTFAGLTVGGSVTVHDLPVNGHCTVTETQTEGAHAVTYSPGATVRIDADDNEITITNVFETGSLVVRADSTGTGLHWANTDFTLHVVCTDGDSTVLDDTFSTPPGGGWKSYTVEEGATCSVTEEVTGGATTVGYSSNVSPDPSPTPVDVIVEAGPQPAILLVGNVFDAAALDVSVTPTGDGIQFASGTTVTVQDCTFNGLPIEAASGATTVPFVFPAGGGHSGIPQLVVGAECLVELTDSGGATSASVEVTNGDPHTTGDESATVTVNAGDTTVAFTTVFEVAGLTVDKILTGDGAWASNTEFAVQVTCTLGGIPIDQLGPDGQVTLRFAPDGSPIEDRGRAALQTLPVAAACALDETQTGGATSVAYSANPVVIDAGGSIASVQNTFAVGSLTVTKTVAGNDAASHVDTPFTFQLGCTFNGQPIGSPPSDTQPTTFHMADGGAATFVDRPAGADCTVTEVETREATSVTPDVTQTATIVDGEEVIIGFTNTFDVATLTLTEVLTGPGAETYGQPLTFRAVAVCTFPDGSRATLPDAGRVLLNEGNGFTGDILVPVGSTCAAEQALFFASAQSISDPVEILLGDEHAITITSDYRLGELTVSKTAVGDFDADQEFGFAITCTWPQGDVQVPLNGNEPGQFTLTSGTDRTVEALAYTTCVTTETSAAGALRVVSDATGSGAVSGDTTASVVILDAQPAEVDVTNYMPGSLPVTGGELRTLLVIAGLLVLAGVAVVVIRMRLVRT